MVIPKLPLFFTALSVWKEGDLMNFSEDNTLEGSNGVYEETVFMPQIFSWRDSLDSLPANEACFEKYLFTASSKVLLGEKPCELLLLREDPSFGGTLDSLLERGKKLTCSWGLLLYILGIITLGARIVIYNRERVNRVLKKSKNTALFVRSGYSRYSTAEDFFAEIGRRWEQTGEIPHEIGVALGYPVKDVVGFLGLAPLKYVGNYGWKVFGTEEPSVELRNKYDKAKKAALRFLEEPRSHGESAQWKLLH